jgi:coenzyme PQQ precursor peptide PqqA
LTPPRGRIKLVLKNPKRSNVMAWKTPKIAEIALGAEINSYACAEAKK